MTLGPEDWRITPSHDHLAAAKLVWSVYRKPSDTWDHDHCEFCFRKYAQPDPVAEDAITEGYATTECHAHGNRYHWICPSCFEHFQGRFRWVVQRS